LTDSSIPYSISFVIIGLNEEKMIARCVESILGIDYPIDKMELIYVDSGSRDHTLEIVSKYPITIVQLKTDTPSAGLGRNEGLKICKGDLVQFIDGDCMIDSQWLKNSLPYMAGNEIACVTGRRKELFCEKSIYNKLIDLTWQNAPSGYVHTPGGGGLFKKSILQEVGPYDPNMTAEEAELDYRIIRKGYKILNIVDIMIHHDVDISSLFQYLKRAIRNGYGTAQIFKKYRHSKDKPRSFYSTVIKADAQVILFIAMVLSFSLGRFPISCILASCVGIFVLRKVIKTYLSSRSLWMSFFFPVMSFLSRCAGFIGYIKCSLEREGSAMHR